MPFRQYSQKKVTYFYLTCHEKASNIYMEITTKGEWDSFKQAVFLILIHIPHFRPRKFLMASQVCNICHSVMRQAVLCTYNQYISSVQSKKQFQQHFRPWYADLYLYYAIDIYSHKIISGEEYTIAFG